MNIWKSDHHTHNSSDLRDYIKVLGQAQDHMRPLHRHSQTAEFFPIHVGIGIGFSVIDVVCDFKQDSGKPIHNCMGPYLSSDIAACYADPYLVLLGWCCEPDMAAWCWQCQNPQDFKGS